MREFTKREFTKDEIVTAIKKTIDMWKWLAETGCDNKSKYFDHIEVEPDLRPKHECYLCDLFNRRDMDYCYAICPLVIKDSNNKTIRCNDDDEIEHPYDEWKLYGDFENETEDRKRCANKIVSLCEDALLKLQEG